MGLELFSKSKSHVCCSPLSGPNPRPADPRFCWYLMLLLRCLSPAVLPLPEFNYKDALKLESQLKVCSRSLRILGTFK